MSRRSKRGATTAPSRNQAALALRDAAYHQRVVSNKKKTAKSRKGRRSRADRLPDTPSVTAQGCQHKLLVAGSA